MVKYCSKGNKTMTIYQSIGFHFDEHLPYPVLKGIGRQIITNQDYHWANSKRKDSHCLLQLTISGKGIFQTKNQQFQQQAWDLFLTTIPSNSQYFIPSSSEKWEIIYLEFSNDSLPIFSEILKNSGPVMNIANEKEIQKQIFELYELAISNKITTFHKNSSLAYQLLMELCTISLRQEKKAITKIDSIKEYIDQNFYQQTLNLDELADYAEISKFYVAREFHKKYGITINNYLTRLRIEHSCRLLKQNNFTIKEIAEMVGYSNDNYFGKVFKKIKGITPNTYRQNSNQYDIVRIIHSTPKINSDQ